MDIILCGAAGRMGRQVCALVEKIDDMRIAAAVDKAQCDEMPMYSSISQVKEQADVILDFSHHSAIGEIVDFALSHHVPLVVATTGHTKEERERIFKRRAQSRCCLQATSRSDFCCVRVCGKACKSVSLRRRRDCRNTPFRQSGRAERQRADHSKSGEQGSRRR